MRSYLQILQDVMDYGVFKSDRTGTGTRALFGYQWRHNMANGFPLLTTKYVPLRWIAVELTWFLNGRTDQQFLLDHGVDIWKEWVRKDGTLGRVYGAQWREWRGVGSIAGALGEVIVVDQIERLISSLKHNPDSRRHIVTAWNPAEVEDQALPPCHTLWQCGVFNHQLSLHLFARSIDTFLGLPFNIASYALLLKILANVCGYNEGELIISFSDLHIYTNHFKQVDLQRSRSPKKLPKVTLRRQLPSPEDFTWDDVLLEDYDPHPKIPAPVAV